MKKKIEELFAEYGKILDSQKFEPSELDYGRVEHYIALIKTLDELESSCFEIFDLHRRRHVYHSQKFVTMLGLSTDRTHSDGNDDFESRIHPDDYYKMLEVGNYFLKFGFDLKPEERKKGKLIMDFRFRSVDDEYIRITKQYRPLELDKYGNVWLSLGIINISPDSDIEKPLQSKLITDTGEVFYFPSTEDFEVQKSPLSEREIQVLELIAKGFPSKTISEKLFISVNTVNTHRQRIIEKLNVSNTTEAVKMAMDIKLIL